MASEKQLPFVIQPREEERTVTHTITMRIANIRISNETVDRLVKDYVLANMTQEERTDFPVVNVRPDDDEPQPAELQPELQPDPQPTSIFD